MVMPILKKIDQLDRDNEMMNEALDRNLFELQQLRRKYGRIPK